MFFKNKATIDLRVLEQCLPKIDRFRIGGLFMALYKSIMADGLDATTMDNNDSFFVPRNEYERKFWESCRELAKRDMKIFITKQNNGSKGGRPPISESEKKAAVEDFKNTFGKPTGKYEVRITKDFKLPSHPYFEDYRNQYPSDLLENVEKWLIKTKLGENVEYQWIGKQIQNFNKRKTGKVF